MKPNILVLMADEHHWQTIAAAGHSVVKTPHLDGLVTRGVRFANAYCQDPLCSPSRMSILTGKHVHEIHVWSNQKPLRSSELTIPMFLRNQGYLTGCIGKMHFRGRDQSHGFEVRPFGDRDGRIPTVKPREGAQESMWSHVRRLMNTTEREVREESDVIAPEQVWKAHPVDDASENEFDRRVTKETTRFLRGWRDRQYDTPDGHRRPFFLWASWLRPHFPMTPPKKYWDLYESVKVESPTGPLDPLKELPQRLSKWRRSWGWEGMSPEEIRRGRRAYYAMVSFMDDQVGMILSELRSLGLEDKTWIIYLSDHGEMCGEHGLWFKSVFFDGSAKVPLILVRPGVVPENKIVDDPVSLIDLFPTLAEISTADIPAGLSGGSLLPIAKGTGPCPSDAVYCEHYTQGVPSLQRMIRTKHWKFNYYEGERGELYNMDNDPNELTNLASDAAYTGIISELQAKLLDTWNLGDARDEVIKLMSNRVGTGFSYSGPNRRFDRVVPRVSR